MAQAKAESEAKQPRYPYYHLRACLNVGEIVRDAGGDRVGVSKAVIASHVEMDHGSSAFAQLMASTKAFGICDGTRELMLTDAGKDYFYPQSDYDRRKAELAFLVCPTAFRFLAQKFDGAKLPGPTTLANVLMRECEIPKSWAGRVALNFVSTIGELSLIDQSGFLRYTAELHKASAGNGGGDSMRGATKVKDFFTNRGSSGPDSMSAAPITGVQVPQQPVQARPYRTDEAYNVGTGNSTVSWTRPCGDDFIRVDTPADMTLAQWETLNRYIESLKPPQ